LVTPFFIVVKILLISNEAFFQTLYQSKLMGLVIVLAVNVAARQSLGAIMASVGLHCSIEKPGFKVGN
jgi:hypothetical protein